MLVLVCYDVATDTPAGRKRLRRVAKVCLNYGQRVQKSVFECRVNEMQHEELERHLLKEVKLDEDNLRIYRLREPADRYRKEYGTFQAVNFEKPLVL